MWDIKFAEGFQTGVSTNKMGIHQAAGKMWPEEGFSRPATVCSVIPDSCVPSPSLSY